MGLAEQFARAERQWLEPYEPDDPLEDVEHPRERKPWKRDRDAIHWQMQRAMNLREWRTIRNFGNGWQHATSLQAQYRQLNHAEFEVRRALLKIDDLGRMHAAARAEHVARLRRYVLFSRELRMKARPSPNNSSSQDTER